jgi:conjugal transfer pilus assembly protein TraF
MKHIALTALACLFALVILFGSNAMANSLSYESVWKCDASRWNWYCDEEAEKKNDALRQEQSAKAAKEKPDTKKKPLAISEIKSAEELRAELKRREDVAIMDPTPQNIRGYLEMNAFMQSKASNFADSWRRVVWQNPDLDYSQKRPVNNAANKMFVDERDKKVEQHLKALAKEHGILFFYRSDCPYCHAVVPVLQNIASKYGFEVLAVATDGRALPGWSAAFRSNDGQFEALLQQHGLKDAVVPAIFIASKATGETAPIGMGVLANSELIERIFVLTGTKVGDEF